MPLRRRVIPAVLLWALALAASAATPAHATETQWWTVDQASEHAESELRGTTVRPDGAFELGPRSTRAADDSIGTVWAIALLRDGSVALAGDRGRIDRWTAAGGVRPWVRLAGAGQVLSLAADGDGVIAGTGPFGTIYRVGARGDTAVLVRTGERYVWGLAPGPNGSWYAATGTRGRIMRITGGKARIVLDTDESNLVCIAADGRGGAYAGGDSKGRVVHVTANGAVSTVFDAPEDEVRALAVGPDGVVYAAGLSASAVVGAAGGGDDVTAAAASSDAGDTSGSASASVSASAGGAGVTVTRGTTGRATVYRILPDSSVSVWWSAGQPLIYGLAVTPQGLVAATGNRAGVYLVPRAGAAQAWLAAPEGQVTALIAERSGRVLAATSNPAALWVLGPGRAERGELTSPIFDARRLARWGHIGWRGAGGGGVALETRSGNTDHPDTTWTAWRRADRDRVASPSGRYLQWKATLTGPARVDAVDVAWREQNLPPRVEEIVIAPQGQAFREGELIPRTEPVTQTLPGGQRVEYSIPSPATPQQLRELPAWTSGVRTVQWRGADPNGDPLRYRIDVAPGPDGPWTKLDEDLTNPAYSWDTHTLPDGSYRLRITASDADGNAVGEELATTVVSEPFRVDNTPPEVTAFTARPDKGAIRIEGRARDAANAIARIEAAVDNAAWRPVTPDGGFADTPEATFHATLRDVGAGEHQVGVRVVDLAGNAATRATRVTVSAAK